MEGNFDILKNIEKVKAPDDIYGNVLTKIQESQTVSSSWIRAALVVFFVLLCFEFFLCKKAFIPKEEKAAMADSYKLSNGYVVTNNYLYNE